ncbi:GumC family protein [Planctomycetaceae bacterium SH139]
MIQTQHADHQPHLNVIQAIWRNKWKMSFVFVLSVAAAVGYLFIAKKQFTSEAQLFVRLGKETIGLDPTVTTGQTIAIQESREKEISSIQSMVRSRTILEQVVEQVGAGRVLGETDDEGPSWLPIDIDYLKSLSPAYVDSPSDKAIATLEKKLEVFSPRNTAIIGLRYETNSPDLAAEILDAVITASIDAQIRVHQSEGSSQFFIAQTDVLAQQVDELELGLLEFKNSSGLSDLGPQRQAQIAQIAALESALLETSTKYEAACEDIRIRRSLLAEQPSQIKLSETTGLASSAAQGMREQLYDLEIREKELIARLKPDHPELVQVQKQLKDAKSTLMQEADLKQVTIGLNESFREIEAAMLNQQALAASLLVQKAVLKEQIAEAKLALQTINANELTLAQLTRKLDLARDSHRDYARRSEQARMDLALSKSAVSNISVLQPPSQSLIPSSPKLALTLVFGMTAGTFLSVLLALMVEIRRQAVATAAHANAVSSLRTGLTQASEAAPSMAAAQAANAAGTLGTDAGTQLAPAEVALPRETLPPSRRRATRSNRRMLGTGLY